MVLVCVALVVMAVCLWQAVEQRSSGFALLALISGSLAAGTLAWMIYLEPTLRNLTARLVP